MKLRELVRSYLERDGLEVFSTGSGAEALSYAAKATPDLVVLDLGLPDIPGEEVAREIRAAVDVPILILTASTGEQDRIAGFELGADDYLTKPFSPRELVLRVAGHPAPRAAGVGGPTNRSGRFWEADAWSIDEEQRQVTVRGAAVELTPTEWGVLTTLAARRGGFTAATS